MPNFISKIGNRLKFYAAFYVRSRGDSVGYLRTRGAVIGKNCSLLGGLQVFNSSEPYLVHIGDNVTITQGVIFVTHDGGTRVFRNLSPAWKPGTVKMGTIEIGDNVFIGVGSIVLPNTKIGSNVVIGAGAVVTRDIPSNVVAVGGPARILCTIEEYTQRSLAEAITIPDEYLKDRESYLSQYYWGKKDHK